MVKKILVVACAIIFNVAACGKSNKGSNKAPTPEGPSENDEFKSPSNRVLLFKASAGEHAYIIPLVGVRLYDNGATGYVFQRGCDTEKTAKLDFLGVNSPSQDVPGVTRVGVAGGWNNQCQFDTDIQLKDGQLIIQGEYNRQPDKLDIKMTKTDVNDFFKELKKVTTDKGLDYRFLPENEREDYEDACQTLAGKDCSSLLL